MQECKGVIITGVHTLFCFHFVIFKLIRLYYIEDASTMNAHTHDILYTTTTQ